jgi:hypothetical protein
LASLLSLSVMRSSLVRVCDGNVHLGAVCTHSDAATV